MTEAKSGDTVHIHYVGTLTDGSEFDSSKGRDPLTFVLGTGQIIPGLDAHVTGMKLGDISQVIIPAAQAYGLSNPDNIQEVPRSAMPADMDIQPGAMLQAQSPNGQIMPMQVVSVTDEIVKVDANHPLAGKDLTFDVEIMKIETQDPSS